MPPRHSIDPLEPRTLLTATPSPLRINAGGPALTDSLARPFSADSGFTGGTAVPRTTDIARTADDPLFASYRTGPAFTFSRPLANGHYALFLEFADPTSTAPGQRTFNVAAEGALRLDEFDVFKQAAALDVYNDGTTPDTAVVKCLDVTVADGQLDLAFTGVTGDAIVSAIVLIPTDIPDAARPYDVYHGAYTPGTQRGDLLNYGINVTSQSNLVMLGQGIYNYMSEHKSQLPPDLATVAFFEHVPARRFAGPRTDTAAPRGETSDLESAAWVASLDDYVYLGGGLRYRDLRPDTPLAYENLDRVLGDVNVLMGDGSVRQFDRATAAAMLNLPDAPPADPPPLKDPDDPALTPDPRAVDSMNNLARIATAMRQFANEHAGRYPLTPGLLNGYNGVTPRTFVNPRGTTPLPPSDLPPDDAAAWIDASRDYLYVGGGKSASGPPDTLLAFENPAEMTGGLTLLFNDGHTEFREFRWAFETIARAGAAPRLPLPGDATRDGVVNFDDLLVLARNYNATDAPFTRGDFNYDGMVNFDDLLILAKNYNAAGTTPAPAPTLLPIGSATKPAAKHHPSDLLIQSPRPVTKPKSHPRSLTRRT